MRTEDPSHVILGMHWKLIRNQSYWFECVTLMKSWKTTNQVCVSESSLSRPFAVAFLSFSNAIASSQPKKCHEKNSNLSPSELFSECCISISRVSVCSCSCDSSWGCIHHRATGIQNFRRTHRYTLTREHVAEDCNALGSPTASATWCRAISIDWHAMEGRTEAINTVESMQNEKRSIVAHSSLRIPCEEKDEVSPEIVEGGTK